MIITNIAKKTINNKVILSADIILKNGNRKNLYFKYDRKFSNYIKSDGTTFVAALLLPCMKLHEDIEVDGEISSIVLKNINKIQSLLLKWNIGLTKIRVNPDYQIADSREGTGVACFFSCGVDSFHTLFKHKSDITHMIYIYGFDMPLFRKQIFNKVLRSVKNVSQSMKKELIVVETNVKEISDDYISWDFEHGSALASIGLSLSGGFKRIYIAGSNYATSPYPWGSHPDLDPLWSSGSLDLIHDMPEVTRMEKTDYISGIPLAMQNLKVCFMNTKNAYNCGKCEKCLRTMIYLYILNKLDDCKTFTSFIDPQKVRSLKIDHDVLDHWLTFKKCLENDKNKMLISAINTCLHEYDHPRLKYLVINRLRRLIGDIDQKICGNKLYWSFVRVGLIDQ